MAREDLMHGAIPQSSDKFSQLTPDGEQSTAPGRNSWSSDDCALTDEKEKCEQQSQLDQHFVKWAKVLGVHKQERPKVAYLFVIIVQWNDESQVTIYRSWKNIKELQSDLLRRSKNSDKTGDSCRYLKKTTRRARRAARFQHGTIKRLNMIDSLNQFFEALTHFKDSAQSVSSRQFFKPNATDLNSISWSGDGKTYFYVARDVLGERNNDSDEENQSQFEEEVAKEAKMRQELFSDIAGSELKHTAKEINDVLDKYCEDDPNISWPIKSAVHTALCDFDASDEDPAQNIISLRVGEDVDVLDRNECGWWLVRRINDKADQEDGMDRCGYVPASYLAPMETQGLTERTDSSVVLAYRNQRYNPRSVPNSAFSSISEEDSVGAVFTTDERSSYYADSSSDDLLSPSPRGLQSNKNNKFKSSKDHNGAIPSALAPSQNRETRKCANKGILRNSLSTSTSSSLESLTIAAETYNSSQRPTAYSYSANSKKDKKVEDYEGSQAVTSNRRNGRKQTYSSNTDSIYGSASTPSAASSLESLPSIPKMAEPLSRFQSLASIDTCHPSPLERRTFSVASLHTESRSSKAKLISRRRLAKSCVSSHTQSIPNLTTKFSFDAASSLLLDRSSSVFFMARKGVDYISTKEYSAENSDEISFKEGAIIAVLSRNSNGWWLANYRDKTGLVPGVHLMRYKDPIRKLSRHVLDML